MYMHNIHEQPGDIPDCVYISLTNCTQGFTISKDDYSGMKIQASTAQIEYIEKVTMP